MLLLRAPLLPLEITAELRQRFDVRDEADLGPDAEKVVAVATKGDIGLPGDKMAGLPNLKMIAVYGVGFDQIDLDQAKTRGIAVATTPGVLTDAVAEHAVALMLAAVRRVVEGDTLVRSGAWAHKKLDLSSSLRGRVLGILGYGRIGRRIAEYACGFGMRVIYSDLAPAPGEEMAYRTSPVALAEDADVMVIAAAGGPGTDGLVNAQVVHALGPSGLLVNVARGSIVDEADLIKALKEGALGGAALDVFQDEPTPRAEFAALPNVVLTPHISSATVDARLAMGRLVIDNLAAFYNGQPLLTPLDF